MLQIAIDRFLPISSPGSVGDAEFLHIVVSLGIQSSSLVDDADLRAGGVQGTKRDIDSRHHHVIDEIDILNVAPLRSNAVFTQTA
jgi:hypothetical protein